MSTADVDGCWSEIVHHLESDTDGAVVLHGDPGSGKSELLDRVMARCSPAAVLVQVHTADDDGPLSGLGAVVALLVTDPGRVHDTIAAAVPTTESLVQLGHELHQLVRLAPAVGTVVVVDDADRMDPQSQDVLARLARRLTGSGVRLLLSVSTASAPTWRSLPAFVVPTLSLSATLSGARALAGSGADDAVLRIVSTASAGSLATVRDHLRELGHRQLAGHDPLVLPLRPSRGCSDAVLRGLRSLPPDLRTALDTLAAAPRLLPGRMDLPTDSLDVLSDLLALGLVERHGAAVAIRDPRVRSTVFWAMSARERRDVHARISAQYGDADPVRSRWHAALADPRRLGTAVLLEAGGALLEAGDEWAAVETADLALQLGVETTRDADALVGLVSTFIRMGRTSWARRYLRLIARSGVPVDPGRLTSLRVACAVVTAGSPADLDDPDAFDGQFPEENPSVRLFAAMSISHGVLGDTAAADHFERRAVEVLRAVAPERAGQYRALKKSLREGPADGDASLTLLADGLDVELLLLLGQRAVRADRLTAGRALFAHAERESAGSATAVAQATRLLIAHADVAAGRHRAAASRIEAVLLESDAETFVTFRAILEAWYWLSRGDNARADEAAAEARRLAPTHHQYGVSARLAAQQGHFALMRDEPEAALHHLRHAMRTAPATADATHLRVELDHLEALVAAGYAEDARTAFQTLAERVADQGTRWSRLGLARAQILVARDRRSLLQPSMAVRHWTEAGSRFDLARTTLCLADRLRALGAPDEARPHLLEARSLMEDLGASGWQEAISERLRVRTVAPVMNPTLRRLTVEERRVVEGVVAGKRNKDIAAELFLAVRTVELRLTSVYRKVGVTSRAALAATLAQSPDLRLSTEATVSELPSAARPGQL